MTTAQRRLKKACEKSRNKDVDLFATLCKLVRRYTAYMRTLRVVAIIAASLTALALWGCVPVGQGQDTVGGTASNGTSTGTDTLGSTDEELAHLFETQQHDVYVTGVGFVERILSDDTQGDRHQRFILRLASGQTLLVTHNIDIAPRVEPLTVGDEVHFAGIYEYNSEGGVIHWTHHDPDGTHRGGFLRVGGKEYS
jgi:hypothetical protein